MASRWAASISWAHECFSDLLQVRADFVSTKTAELDGKAVQLGHDGDTVHFRKWEGTFISDSYRKVTIWRADKFMMVVSADSLCTEWVLSRASR